MGGDFWPEMLRAAGVVFATAFAGWLLDRWLGVREKVSVWINTRRDRAQAREKLWEAIPRWIDDAASLRDGIKALNDREGVLTAQFKALSADVQRVAHIASDTLAMKEMDFEWSAMPKFICDPSAKNIRVNRAYFQALGVTREDLMGFGYRSFIARDELGPYLARVMAAITEHRNHVDQITFLTPTGPKRFEVSLLPHPPYADMGALKRIVGTMEAIE